MKILVLSPFLPSETPRHGGERLMREMLEHLGRRHQVGLIAFSHRDSASEAGWLESHCSFVRTVPKDIFHIPPGVRFRNLFSSVPSWFLHTASSDFAAEVRKALSFEPDIVQVEFLAMAPYVDRLEHPAVVFNTHEAFGRSWVSKALANGWAFKTLYLLFDYARLARAEIRMLERFRAVLAFSREDRDYFLSENRNAPVHVWSPGAVPAERTEAPDGSRGRAPPPAELLFLGAFDHPPNVEGIRFFCKKIYPGILRKNTDVCLHIIGPNPPAGVRALEGDRVVVHGFVEDLKSWYRRRPVMIAPILRGGGIRMKLLEALGWGLPVVTTPAGAEGIEAVRGEHWLVADTPDAFARSVNRFLSDPGFRIAMGSRAREWVRVRLDWERALDRLDEIYRQIR